MTTVSDLKNWMSQAIAEARRSGEDVPVGSLVVKEGRIIGKGHNQKEVSCDPTDHAEIVAIREAARHQRSWRLQGCLLVSTLEPCPMCAEAIIQARFSHLVFGAYDPRSGACGSRFNLFAGERIYPLPEVIGGMEEQACQSLLHDFFEARRKQD